VHGREDVRERRRGEDHVGGDSIAAAVERAEPSREDIDGIDQQHRMRVGRSHRGLEQRAELVETGDRELIGAAVALAGDGDRCRSPFPVGSSGSARPLASARGTGRLLEGATTEGATTTVEPPAPHGWCIGATGDRS
jgi:hypothetical protein